jgi:hypothetical protein
MAAGSITIDPQGTQVTANWTPSAGVSTLALSDGGTPVTWPRTVSTRTTFYASRTESGSLSLKVAGIELATAAGSPAQLTVSGTQTVTPTFSAGTDELLSKVPATVSLGSPVLATAQAGLTLDASQGSVFTVALPAAATAAGPCKFNAPINAPAGLPTTLTVSLTQPTQTAGA